MKVYDDWMNGGGCYMKDIHGKLWSGQPIVITEDLTNKDDKHIQEHNIIHHIIVEWLVVFPQVSWINNLWHCFC